MHLGVQPEPGTDGLQGGFQGLVQAAGEVMRGKPWAPRPLAGLALSPGLHWAFGCTASRSAPKGEVHLSITGCLEGKGVAGNVFKESSPVLYQHREWGVGDKMGVPATPVRGRWMWQQPPSAELVPWERRQSRGGEGYRSPTCKDVWLFFFPPQSSFIRPAATTFPHKPPLSCVLRLPQPQHHCCSIAAIPGSRGQAPPGDGTGGERAQVHQAPEPSSHQNWPGGCDWNLICLVCSVDILISISYNLLGKEAQLAAAWLNGLCTQSNLLHSPFPVLENLSVSLSEVSIAITAVLVKHWKWQPIQIVILLDSNCSSLHWPLKCYFSGAINHNWRRLVLCLCFQQTSSPPPQLTLLAVCSVLEPWLTGKHCWAHHTSATVKTRCERCF